MARTWRFPRWTVICVSPCPLRRGPGRSCGSAGEGYPRPKEERPEISIVLPGSRYRPPCRSKSARFILRCNVHPLSIHGRTTGSDDGLLIRRHFESNLFDDLRRFDQEMDELLDRFAWPVTRIRSVARGTFPAVNIGATPAKVDVYLFAPGLDPKKLELSMQQNLLTVSGERKVPVEKQSDYYRQERYSGEFRRVITLPDDVDPDRVDARYRDGVLQISVTRREAARPRQITVQ